MSWGVCDATHSHPKPLGGYSKEYSIQSASGAFRRPSVKPPSDWCGACLHYDLCFHSGHLLVGLFPPCLTTKHHTTLFHSPPAEWNSHEEVYTTRLGQIRVVRYDGAFFLSCLHHLKNITGSHHWLPAHQWRLPAHQWKLVLPEVDPASRPTAGQRHDDMLHITRHAALASEAKETEWTSVEPHVLYLQ